MERSRCSSIRKGSSPEATKEFTGTLDADAAAGAPKAHSAAFSKVKNKLLNTVAELKEFRSFMKGQFSTPGVGFDTLADGANIINREKFVVGVKNLGFTGSAEAVFNYLCEEDGECITRESFKERMRATAKQGGKMSSITDVVKTAIDQKKANALRDFAVAVRKIYPQEASAFLAFSSGQTEINRESFVRNAKATGFLGDIEVVFTELCNKNGLITRDVFCGRGLYLETAGDHSNPATKENNQSSNQEVTTKRRASSKVASGEASPDPQASAKKYRSASSVSGRQRSSSRKPSPSPNPSESRRSRRLSSKVA